MDMYINKEVDIKIRGFLRSNIVKGRVIEVIKNKYEDWLGTPYINTKIKVSLTNGKIVVIDSDSKLFNRYSILNYEFEVYDMSKITH